MHASNIWFKKSEMVVVSFLQFKSSLFHIYIYIFIYYSQNMSDISNFVLFRLKNLKLSPPPDSGGCTGAELQDPPLYGISLICSLCSVEIVYSGINFPVFFFHNLLCAAGFLLCSLVEHS